MQKLENADELQNLEFKLLSRVNRLNRRIRHGLNRADQELLLLNELLVSVVSIREEVG